MAAPDWTTVEACLSRARAAARAGDHARACAEFQRARDAPPRFLWNATDDDPRDWTFLWAFARARVAAARDGRRGEDDGDDDDDEDAAAAAARLYDAAAASRRAAGDTRKQRLFEYERGRSLARAGRFADARDALSAALDADPRHVPSRLKRGQVHSALQDFEAALRDLDAVLARRPRHASALQQRAMVHVQRQAFDRAARDFAASMVARPSAAVATQWGFCLLQCGENGAAATAYGQALALDGSSAEAREGLARATRRVEQSRADLVGVVCAEEEERQRSTEMEKKRKQTKKKLKKTKRVQGSRLAGEAHPVANEAAAAVTEGREVCSVLQPSSARGVGASRDDNGMNNDNNDGDATDRGAPWAVSSRGRHHFEPVLALPDPADSRHAAVDQATDCATEDKEWVSEDEPEAAAAVNSVLQGWRPEFPVLNKSRKPPTAAEAMVPLPNAAVLDTIETMQKSSADCAAATTIAGAEASATTTTAQ